MRWKCYIKRFGFSYHLYKFQERRQLPKCLETPSPFRPCQGVIVGFRNIWKLYFRNSNTFYALQICLENGLRSHGSFSGMGWVSNSLEKVLVVIICFDESLWQTVDLAGRNLYPDVVGRLLSRGVVAFRCPRSFMDQPLVEHFSRFRLQHLDLLNLDLWSMCLPCTAFCLTSAPSCRISAWKASDFRSHCW